MSKNFFLKSCNNCMLPETYETFEFDDKGVCNVCNSHKNKKMTGPYHAICSLNEVLPQYDDFKYAVIGFSRSAEISVHKHNLLCFFDKNS